MTDRSRGTERETTRLIAWGNELRRAHALLRDALAAARAALDTCGDPPRVRELLLYCRGFCVALGDHHRGEDRALFPVIEAEHPELTPVLRALTQDHSMMDHLLAGLESAAAGGAPPAELERHLDGLGAIMESHFRYEERQLLAVLDALALRADPRVVLGPL